MAHYALLNDENIVVFVTVARDEDEHRELEISAETGQKYRRTSYNTRGGVHYQPDNNTPSENQNKAFRKNYAGLGYSYDDQRDAFIPPKPYPSWILDEFSCLWNSPIPYPDMANIPEPYKIYNRCFWNEDIINWELQKPFNSWLLNQDNYYVSPTPYPSDDKQYYWDEETASWVEIVLN
jgi:hypothetical protein